MNNIHIICNPTSGKGTAGAVLNKIKDWIKSENDLKIGIHLTEKNGHATEIAKTLTSNDEDVTILVIGGDGTIGEVLNGICNFEKTKLGILPFGSGNDFVKAVDYKKHDPIEMVKEYIYSPKTIKCDYLLINDKYKAINSCGLGMSAESIANRDKMKHFKPKTQYKIAVLKAGLFWKLFTYDVSIDNKPTQKISTMWFAMSNGSTIGGGFVTAADAKVNDGIMNVLYLNKFNHLFTLKAISKTKKGKIYSFKKAVHFTCKEIEIVGNKMNVEYDGNLLKNVDKLNVKLIPGKLNLLIC